jgi:decaprenylphospho-beta-D-ribofuranose 2-oxidase
MWYRRAPRERRDELQGISRFFHPQDALRDWHNVYGPAGLLQYQFVVPATAADVLHAVIERFAQRKLPAMLSTLKRFGQPSGGHLSFPCPGWALAIDVPARTGALARTLAECDRLIAECGGRVYLAKDAHLSAELVSVMYPRLEEWSAIREQADPDGVLVSDQARRLRLVRADAR